MTLPTTDTVVLYPGGALTAEARVLHVEPLDDGRAAVLLDRTSCHPVDAGWPDQGPDRAVLDAGDVALPVLDAVVAASDGETLFLGADIPVRKGTEGWAFVVAHIVADEEDATLTEGDLVTVSVDGAFRDALSLGHTGCHLASLALNAAVAAAGAWSKQVLLDASGSPDFDALAIETSTIVEHGSVDVYRLGKSLRKKGFAPDALAASLSSIEADANAALAAWVAAGGGIRIDTEGDTLTARRYWVAELPGGEVRIPCGGTHASSLAELGAVRVTLALEQLEGAQQLTMTTRVGQP